MFTIWLIFLSLFSANFSKIVEIECPPHCKCDIFETFRRATCQNRNLVVLESNIPSQTELLDLSFNQISKLTNNIFFEQNLLSLKLLNISHNKLSKIHMNAFEGMSSLKTLDLSYNIIQYILINWFWSLTSLDELYLRGNGLSSLNSDGPLLESKTLKVLDLSACAITFINNDSFIKLPNLEVINLSENYLQQIDSTAIRPLSNLLILNTKNNTMECTSVTEKLAAYCTQKGIQFANPCAIKSLNSDKMERMVAVEDPPEEKNSWMYDDEVETSTFIEVCGSNSTTEEVHQAGLLMSIIALSPTLSIVITLVYGIMIGLVIGCTVQINRKKSTHQANDRPASYRSFDIFNTNERNRQKDEDFEDMLITNELVDLNGTTPVAHRKFTPDNN